MNPEQIREIEERGGKITQGEWAIETPCGFPYTGIYIVSHKANDNKDFHSFIAEIRQYRKSSEGKANADFIANAKTDIAALLAHSKAETARADKAEAEVERLMQANHKLKQVGRTK